LISPNQCEFLGYFVIFQIGNGGEVTKYLQRLPVSVLKSKELTFSIAVWKAIRTENYAQFFVLLKKANVLQKCLLYRYLGEMRLKAMKKILKTYSIQSKTANVKMQLALSYFQELLLFDSLAETADFFDHCSIAMVETPQGYLVSIEGQNIESQLPRDVNDLPIRPKVPMINNLMEQMLLKDSQGNYFTVQELCRGEFKQQEKQKEQRLTGQMTPAPKKTIKLNLPASLTKTPTKTTGSAVIFSPPPFESPAMMMTKQQPIPAAPTIAPVPVNPPPLKQQPAATVAMKQQPQQKNPFAAPAPAATAQPFVNPPFGVAPVSQQQTTSNRNPFLAAAAPPVAANNNKNPFAAAATPQQPQVAANLNPNAKSFIPGGIPAAAAVAATPAPVFNANPFTPQPGFAGETAGNKAPTGTWSVPTSVQQQQPPVQSLKRPSKDFTTSPQLQSMMPPPPAAAPQQQLVFRQKSSDKSAVMPPPPVSSVGVPFRMTREPEIVLDTSPATALSSLGSKHLPLLSATSIDEFMTRQNSTSTSLSGFPPPAMEVPVLSRQPSSVSMALASSSADRNNNALTMAKSLSTSRGALHQPSPPPKIMKTPSVSSSAHGQQFPLSVSSPAQTSVSAQQVESPRLQKLEKEFQKKRKLRIVKHYFKNWKEMIWKRLKQINLLHLKQSFRRWNRYYHHSIQAKEEFYSSVRSIKIQPQSNEFLMIEAPSSGSHPRNSFGQSKKFPPKRKPLREYSVKSPEKLLLEEEIINEELIKGEGRGNQRNQSQYHEGASYPPSFYSLLTSSILSPPRPSSSTISSSSLSPFLSCFLSILGMPCYLQKKKQFEKTFGNSVNDSLEQFIDKKPLSILSQERVLPFNLVCSNPSDPFSFFPTLFMKDSFFHSAANSSLPSTGNNHLFLKVLLITPSKENGLFVTGDDPLLAMFRSSFMNQKGFYSNFQREKNERKVSEGEEEDDYQIGVNSSDEKMFGFTRTERLNILKLFQNHKLRVNNDDDDNDENDFILKNDHCFQLGLYDSYDYQIRFQSHDHPSKESFLSCPVHLSVSETSLSASSSPPSAVESCHCGIIFLSNYYHHYTTARRQQENLLFHLQSNIPFHLFVVVYLSSEEDEGEREEEKAVDHEIMEFSGYPTHSEIVSFYEKVKKTKKSNKSPIKNRKNNNIREMKEIELLCGFLGFGLFDGHEFQLIQERVITTTIYKKYSNQIYEQRIMKNTSFSPEFLLQVPKEDYTTSIPLLQFQLTSVDEKNYLQRVFMKSMNSMTSNFVVQQLLIPERLEKDANALVAIGSSSLHLSNYFLNPLIEKYFFKDFISFHLFTVFDEFIPTAFSMIAPDQKPTFAIYYQMFIRILKEYQLCYHDFIERFQHCSASSFTSLLELQEFTDSTDKIDSFGIMSLKSPIFSSRTNDGATSDSVPSNQFLSVWIPSQWNHSFYSQKCEILVSNVIYPIEEFLKNSANSDSSFSFEQEMFQKLEALDDLAIPKEDRGANKSKKTQNKANRKTKEGILTFKNSFQLLLSSSDNKKHQNDPSLLVLMEVEIMKMIQRIFIQRFEILYPLMKEFYAPKNDGGGSSVPLSVLNDFDSTYYCHHHPGNSGGADYQSRNERRNPFLQYSLEHQQLKQQKQLHHLEKLLTEMDTQSKKSVKTSAAKGKKLIEDMVVATSGKKSSPGASLTPAIVTLSSAKAEKRPLVALYDTPTIGADSNPSLLKDYQQQQFSQQLVNHEEEEGETKSCSPHNNNFEGEDHQQHHFEESQKKRKKNEVVEQTEQQQQLLKEKVAKQKKSSRKFLEFLEQQIMN
jgi:hypothetical protein